VDQAVARTQASSGRAPGILQTSKLALIPATRKECAACLDKAGRVFGYPKSWYREDGEGDDITASIWLDALADIPLDLLADAVDRYINAVPPNRWFPKPGELRALCAEEMQERRNDRRFLASCVGGDIRSRDHALNHDHHPVARPTAEEIEAIWESHGGRPETAKLRPAPVNPLYVVDEIPKTVLGQPWCPETPSIEESA
jgi:hypothetical protein